MNGSPKTIYNDPELAYAEAERRVAEAVATGGTSLSIESLAIVTLPANIKDAQALVELNLTFCDQRSAGRWSARRA